MEYIRKSQLTEDKSKHHENTKGSCGQKLNIVLGKNGGHRPSSLGSRSILVVSEWDEMLSVIGNFKIRQLQF